jgi:hypothetical protein
MPEQNLDPRTLAQHLAPLNIRWLRRTPLPDGRPLTYACYRRLLRFVIAEHLEGDPDA